MPAAPFAATFATDEDCLARRSADFHLIVPDWQRAAFGVDGQMTSWALSSASCNFVAAGLGPGSVLCLTLPAVTAWRESLVYVSGTVGSPNTATLRRMGMAAGAGAVPVLPSSPVRFFAPTALPQLLAATRQLCLRFGFADVTTPDEPDLLRDVCALMAILDLLGTAHRAAKDEDNFHIKYKDLIAERDLLLKLLDKVFIRETDGDPPARSLRVGQLAVDPTWRVPRGY
jgi:hypothetical protein